MSDVADMLGLSAKSSSANLVSEETMKIMSEKVKVKGAKKPKGMSREVYDLLGKDGLVPAVQGNVVAPSFKNKRANALKGKWIWTSINSSARSHNPPVFYHWIKAEQSYVDYPYASFNVKLDTFQYTDEEYEKFLNEDTTWSKADTDELVRVCHQYDLRWPIIGDRIELSVPRAVEDMQDRYYFVRAVVQAKRLEQLNPSAVPASVSSGFNVQQERKRRRAQDMLFKKTKEDELEEAQLREELKAIDAALKKNKKAKAASEPAAAASSAAAASTSTSATVSAPAGNLGPGLVPRTVLAAPGAGGAADPALAAAAAAGTLPNLPTTFGPAPGRPCLQSSRLYSGTVPPLNLTGSLAEYGVTKQDAGLTGNNLSKKMINKMILYLRELEIPENPLPTKAVCDAVEQVKLSTVTLLSLHNLIARKEKELALLQAGGLPEGAGDGAGSSKSRGGRSVKKEGGSKSARSGGGAGGGDDAAAGGAAGAGVASVGGVNGGGAVGIAEEAGAAGTDGVVVKMEVASEAGDEQASSHAGSAGGGYFMDVAEDS